MQILNTYRNTASTVKLQGIKVSVILFQDGNPKESISSPRLYYSVAQWRGIFMAKCNLVSSRDLIASGKVRSEALQYL